MKYKIIDKITGEILEAERYDIIYEELKERIKNYFENNYFINLKNEKEEKTRTFTINIKY